LFLFFIFFSKQTIMLTFSIYMKNIEIEFTKIFLIFYRKFLRPSELLDLLMDRFEQYDNSENKNSTTIHPVQLR